ncbi:MAG: hypothetical protein ACK5MT_17080 [Actinomycetales bacterium]
MSPVARHLVMAAALLDDDPTTALEHARVARHHAGRVGVVREAAGIAAYRAGEYLEALRELRAARRLTGSDEQLALIADSERALGRADKALEITRNPPAGLSAATQVELLIVGAGVRQDLDDLEGARQILEIAELDVPPTAGSPEARQARARLMSAYADILESLGREREALSWLTKAATADVDGSTGAAERLGGDTEVIVDLDDAVDGAPDAPDLDAPDLDAPDPDAPDLDAPDLDAPDPDAPDLDGPDLDGPDLDGPDLGAPDLDAPDLGAPDPGAPDLDALDSGAPEDAADLGAGAGPEPDAPSEAGKGEDA